MGKYPNANRTWEIIYIDRQKMRLSDESKWQFLPTMSPPSLWKARDGNNEGDKVRPEDLLSSDVLYGIVGVSKKGTNTQAMYLGGAKGEASDINVTKSMTDTEYPASHLERAWKIKKAAGNLIVLEDDSVWKLTAILLPTVHPRGVSNWEEGQYATISRDPVKNIGIRAYKVKNQDTGVSLTGTFEGWER